MTNKIDSTAAYKDQSMNPFIKQKHYVGKLTFPYELKNKQTIRVWSSYQSDFVTYKILSECVHKDKYGNEEFYEYKVKQVK